MSENEENKLTPEAVESQLTQERAGFEETAGVTADNLDKLDSASPSRLKKIEAWMDRNTAELFGAIIGVGEGGVVAIGSNAAAPNWEMVAVGLGVGILGAKALKTIWNRKKKEGGQVETPNA